MQHLCCPWPLPKRHRSSCDSSDTSIPPCRRTSCDPENAPSSRNHCRITDPHPPHTAHRTPHNAHRQPPFNTPTVVGAARCMEAPTPAPPPAPSSVNPPQESCHPTASIHHRAPSLQPPHPVLFSLHAVGLESASPARIRVNAVPSWVVRTLVPCSAASREWWPRVLAYTRHLRPFTTKSSKLPKEKRKLVQTTSPPELRHISGATDKGRQRHWCACEGAGSLSRGHFA